MLTRAGGVSRTPDAALLARIAASVKPTLRPVRPMAPSWMLASGLALICVGIVLAGARGASPGLEKLSLPECLIIFPTLGILIWVMSWELVGFLIPGTRHYLTSGTLLAVASCTLLALFALLFRRYGGEHDTAAGIVCLRIGLLHAIPVAIPAWLLLRRGFAVNLVATGLVWGTLAGLAGIAAVVLRCDNFQAPHILLWHVGVVPLSAAAGAALGWVIARIRPSGRVVAHP